MLIIIRLKVYFTDRVYSKLEVRRASTSRTTPPWQQSPMLSGQFVLRFAWLTPPSRQMRPALRVVLKGNFHLIIVSNITI